MADRVQVGLVGSLAAYKLEDRYGETKRTDEIDYFGRPAGYTAVPFESINYISKHDNQTLWDINQLKLPVDMPMADRVKVQQLGLAINTFAQGIPFYHMGVDILRSKSLNRDSYDSGDWYNRVDFSLETHNWNIGLPREDKDGNNWALMLEIIKDGVDKTPTKADMQSAHDYFLKLLKTRYESPLFRMRDSADVIEKISFKNTGPEQVPGLIAMAIDDRCATGDLDPAVDEISHHL